MPDQMHHAGGSAAVAELDGPSETLGGSTATRNILLLDGVKLFLRLEETLLQRQGWTIFTAGTGEEAKAILARERVDLLIMDYVLPDVTGDELVRWVRENAETRDMSILIVTARGLREHIDRCMSAGCNAFLFKPVSRTVLCAKVQEMLDVPARRHVRTLIRLEVKASCKDRFFFGNTVNLSVSGVLLETPLDIGLGESIDLRFFLPGEAEAIDVNGRVVRRTPMTTGNSANYGLLFEELTDADRVRIERFVEASSASGNAECVVTG